MSTTTRKLREITAPWDQETVKALNRTQQSPNVHPFTCPNRNNGDHRWARGDLGVLHATHNGWICLSCEYEQNWAHEYMVVYGREQ